MSKPRTQSRALQLVVYDMDPAGKPHDDEIASSWGLADARSVREVRESPEYKHLLLELQSSALSHVGDKVSQMQFDAVDQLQHLIPSLVDATARLLTPPKGIVDKEAWVPPYQNVSAANASIATLIKLSGIGKHEDATKATDSKTQVLPDLRQAKSDSSLVRQEYTLVVERLVKNQGEDDMVEGDYEILQTSDAVDLVSFGSDQ